MEHLTTAPRQSEVPTGEASCVENMEMEGESEDNMEAVPQRKATTRSEGGANNTHDTPQIQAMFKMDIDKGGEGCERR